MRNPVVLCLVVILSVYYQAYCQQDKIKIGISMSYVEEDRWPKESKVMASYLKLMGAKTFFANARNDDYRQFKQVKKMFRRGIDALIIVPVHSKSASQIVNRAHQLRVQVISYDRLILNSRVDYFVTINSVEIGELMAKTLTERKPSGHYVILNGPKEDFNTVLLSKGFYNVLQPLISSGQIQVIHDEYLPEWSGEVASLKVADILKANRNKVDAILCGNDEIAIKVKEILRLNRLNAVEVIGQDADLAACRLIMKKELAGTVWSNMTNLALAAAKVALKSVTGDATEQIDQIFETTINGAFEIPSLLLSPQVITDKNMESVIIDSGFWTRQEVFGE